MIITECSLSHIAQTYCSFAGWVNEVVAFFRVELTGSDDFGQLLHVGRFDVDNIKRLIGNLHMPEIDPVSRLFHKKKKSQKIRQIKSKTQANLPGSRSILTNFF